MTQPRIHSKTRSRVLLSWSSGKDSAWALHLLRQNPEFEVAGLLTTINEAFDRVAMHGVRRQLVDAQANAVGLPLITVPLPWPCSNAQYETVMEGALRTAVRKWEFTHVAFGDLFLEEIRRYREEQMARHTNLIPLFPLWAAPTGQLAAEMINAGLKARLVCVDPRQLPASFAGRVYDAQLLRELPKQVDPCGENGEFHTFVYAGPMFARPLDIECGPVVERHGFIFADLVESPRECLVKPRESAEYIPRASKA